MARTSEFAEAQWESGAWDEELTTPMRSAFRSPANRGRASTPAGAVGTRPARAAKGTMSLLSRLQPPDPSLSLPSISGLIAPVARDEMTACTPLRRTGRGRTLALVLVATVTLLACCVLGVGARWGF